MGDREEEVSGLLYYQFPLQRLKQGRNEMLQRHSTEAPSFLNH